MKTGFGTTMDKPLWTIFKKHYCKECSAKLKLTRITRILKRGTEEHKRFVHRRENYPLPVGDFKLKEVKFKCPKCNITIDILEQYDYEKNLKDNKQ